MSIATQSTPSVLSSARFFSTPALQLTLSCIYISGSPPPTRPARPQHPRPSSTSQARATRYLRRSIWDAVSGTLHPGRPIRDVLSRRAIRNSPASLAPVRGAELIVTEQGVENPDRAPLLDVLVPASSASAYVRQQSLPSRPVKRVLVSQYEPQSKKRLRRDAVVVVPVGGIDPAHGTDGRVSHAQHGRPLECDRIGEPFLAGRPERERRGRDAEELRGDIVVAAVKTP